MDRDREDGGWISFDATDWGALESSFDEPARAPESVEPPEPGGFLDVLEVRIPRPSRVPSFDGFPTKLTENLDASDSGPISADWVYSQR